MNKQIEQILKKIFEKWSDSGEKVKKISLMPSSGSYRKYYRIISQNKTAIGVINTDKKENIAFLEFTKHFLDKGMNVPQIYNEDLKHNVYLIQDIGDTTLFSYLTQIRENTNHKCFPEKGMSIYKKVIEELTRFQIHAGKDLDYSVCYPRPDFDKQSMMWDLNYFKYYFLKFAKIQFDEQKLEDDFRHFSDYLLKTDCSYFLYRDFQSRNIMLYKDALWFIDYQGGRRGALQYDLASLLFDSRADIPQKIRTELIDHYINIITKIIHVDKTEFIQYFYSYVLIRLMQAMGAYGFRGLYEKKEHFLKSIPYAIKNIEWIINTVSIPVKVPTLIDVLKQLINNGKLKVIPSSHVSHPPSNVTTSGEKLKVTINSFSYFEGIPVDSSDNGGGFVFDCRALHNPGRYEEYKHLTGKDNEVIEFFEKHNEINRFLNNIYLLVDQSVEKYQERDFTNLMVNFGCTGGQHRSVYCTEMLAKHLREKYIVELFIKHIALEKG